MTLDKALNTIDPNTIPASLREALIRDAYDQCQRGRMEIRAGERTLIRLGVLEKHSFETKQEQRRAQPLRGGRRARKDKAG